MSEIHKCPWCGGEAKCRSMFPCVVCHQCGARGPEFGHGGGPDAIAAWNALCEVVERLRITVSGNWCCMGMASSGAHDEHCKHVAALANFDALKGGGE